MKHFSEARLSLPLEEQIDQYLRHFKEQHEAGLMILQEPAFEERLLMSLEARGLSEALSWYEALRNIAMAVPTFIMLESPLPRELYELISQYSSSDGIIRIHGAGIIELESVRFNPKSSHLLLVVAENSLREIERRHPVRDKVGMIHRLQ